MDPEIHSPFNIPVISSTELWVLGALTLVFVVMRFWIKWDATRFLASKKKDFEPLVRPNLEWDSLQQRAERVVENIVESLPDDLKEQAIKVPCVYHRWSEQVRGEEDVLGVYKGFEVNVMHEEGGVIALFLGNIFEYCADYALEFEDEVRTTYLHELGHHFGWDEKDLEDRGL